MSRDRARSREAIRLGVLAAVVAASVAGVAIGGRPALHATGLWSDQGSATVSPTFFDPTPSGSASTGAERSGFGVAQSAAPASQGPVPGTAALAAAINALPTNGLGTTAGVVLDAGTGAVLYAKGQQQALIPASTNKVMTCLAALDALGPDHRFTTKVVLANPSRVVLVGGGDPYLSQTGGTYPNPATSAQLAAQTAAALKKAGTTKVSLGYDESLFSGPNWHSSWPDGYHDQVTTISSLWVDHGRATANGPVTRTPALTAAQVFAAQLSKQGITVVGAPVASPGAGTKTGATQVAAVQSLPLRTIVQEVLTHSDNSGAELLLRQVGIADGQGGSFSGGAKAVTARLAKLGVPTAGVRVSDGSGLSRDNRETALALATAMQVAADSDPLRALVEGLPTAGVSGTLGTRFYADQALAGRGWVHAKTGTLSKVSALAGVTRTAKGRDVVFAFVANNQTDEWGVRNWLDGVGAAITGCNC